MGILQQGAMGGPMMTRRSLPVGTDSGNGIVIGGGQGGIIPRSNKCPGGGEMPPPLPLLQRPGSKPARGISNPDMDCIKLEIATFNFGE